MEIVGEPNAGAPARRGTSDRAARRVLLGVSALLFATSASVTIAWSAAMSAMGDMSMPGGWTMSTAWLRMPGQTWPGAALSFVGMWVVMTTAMMRRPSSRCCGATARPSAGRARRAPID